MSKEIKILGAIIIAVAIAAIIGVNLYNNSTQNAVVAPNNDGSKKSSIINEVLVRSDSYKLGDENAKVTIVEFLDPECESCAAFHPIMKKILKDYEGKARLVVRYMPLHPNSVKAANFMEAAGEQGKYWEAQDLLFTKHGEWATKHGQPANAPQPNVDEIFPKYAEELKLNIDQVKTAIADNKFGEKIKRDQKDGESLYVQRTPTIFVNGRKLATLSEPALTYLIDQELKK